MTLGLRTLPFAICLVDAEHLDVPRCVACGNRLTRRVDAEGRAFYWETDHTTYCMVRLAIPFARTPESVLDLEPRG